MRGQLRKIVDKPARERAIVRLAGNQRGAVSREQLLALGMSAGTIDRWVASGRLLSMHRGVYLLGGGVMPEGAKEMAAALACGSGSLVSHLNAASLWKLLPLTRESAPVSVTSPRDRQRPGIEVHRVREIHPSEYQRLRGIPLTSVARTLLDIANLVTREDLELAVGQAMGRGLTTPTQLGNLLRRHTGRPGARVLRKLVGDGDPPETRSPPERRFLALVRAAGLPEPEVGVPIGPYLGDFLWRQQQTVLEVDGFSFHSGRHAFERDHRRDTYMETIGLHVVRATRDQVENEPASVVALVAAVLSRLGRAA